MNDIDYSKLSIKELDEIVAKVMAVRHQLVEKRRAELLEELKQLDLPSSIIGQINTENPAGKAGRRKYKQYSDEKGNLWNGKGRRPAWLAAELERGAELENFLLKNKES